MQDVAQLVRFQLHPHLLEIVMFGIIGSLVETIGEAIETVVETGKEVVETVVDEFTE